MSTPRVLVPGSKTSEFLVIVLTTVILPVAMEVLNLFKGVQDVATLNSAIETLMVTAPSILGAALYAFARTSAKKAEAVFFTTSVGKEVLARNGPAPLG